MDAKERRFALKTARSAIELWAREGKRFVPKNIPESFMEKRGCFVTLTEGGELRGCIGYPEPILPLIEALVDAAISACRDPRFPPLDASELPKIKIEISVLTKPRPIKPEGIKVGRDGLIIRHGYYSGLLLPQVATEYNWSREEFLNHACFKAGLHQDAWKDEETQIFAFQAEVFSE